MPTILPGTAADAPAALWLPRAQLDALLQQALNPGPDGARRALLAHAPLVLQPGAKGVAALAGLPSTQALRALPTLRAGDPGTVPHHGLVLVAILPTGTVLPLGEQAWDEWLMHTAPGYRLATAALNPALVVL